MHAPGCAGATVVDPLLEATADGAAANGTAAREGSGSSGSPVGPSRAAQQAAQQQPQQQRKAATAAHAAASAAAAAMRSSLDGLTSAATGMMRPGGLGGPKAGGGLHGDDTLQVDQMAQRASSYSLVPPTSSSFTLVAPSAASLSAMHSQHGGGSFSLAPTTRSFSAANSMAGLVPGHGHGSGLVGLGALDAAAAQLDAHSLLMQQAAAQQQHQQQQDDLLLQQLNGMSLAEESYGPITFDPSRLDHASLAMAGDPQGGGPPGLGQLRGGGGGYGSAVGRDLLSGLGDGGGGDALTQLQQLRAHSFDVQHLQRMQQASLVAESLGQQQQQQHTLDGLQHLRAASFDQAGLFSSAPQPGGASGGGASGLDRLGSGDSQNVQNLATGIMQLNASERRALLSHLMRMQ